MQQEELQAIGEILRQARETKGLTLAEVEERTKIAAPVLAALESGDGGRLPHPVYAKGFLRSYASLLGLEVAELAARFARAYPVPEEMEDAPEERAAQIRVTVRQPDAESLPWRRWGLRLGAGVGLVLLAIGGWYGFQWYILPQIVALRQAASSAAQPAPQAPPAPTTEIPQVESANVTEEPASPAPAMAESDNASVEESVSNATNSSLASPSPAVAVRVMRVEAVANSWVQAKADGKVTDYFLRQGERVDIAFSSSLRLKLGNAAGVRLVLDGQSYSIGPSRPGEVRTITVP